MGVSLKVGLTGGIASGKSTVASLFETLGIVTIDADVIAHQIVEPGQPALALICEVFGSEIVDQVGRLKRDVLRKRVFANSSQRLKLEAILHPRVRAVMQAEITKLQVPYCLLSIPLLAETQQLELVDHIVVVDCSVELQRKRLKTRNHFTTIEINQIIKAQADRETRLAIANDVIYNDTNIDRLREQVSALHNKLLDKLHKKV